ncbi:hypothetical protein HK099_006176 [Clydaea vesicula]|uniref:NADP-dependent oxidoreductase domain-containing protein n=1 Tax=Clydaea vesicula TaxID=447962 RepID=A0AAD5TYK0_9FUNG|nr:hypothetical protein HK099_006176 [Clydaea vesicula]KAJ3389721.1 hypothetical protein HDU92_000919 [Lobulomyces angularis]
MGVFVPVVGSINLPAIGIGTFQLKGENLRTAILEGVKTGYRLIDTAEVYRNEEEIGVILNEVFNTGLCSREEMWITTKISPKSQGYEKAYKSIQNSLKNLNLKYLNLVLIHWPGAANIAVTNLRNAELRKETYQAMIKAKDEGLIKFIGVSNFNENHLTKLIDAFPRSVPTVNQIEVHIQLPQLSLIEFCKKRGITVQGYSTLGQGKLLNGSISIPTVEYIAKTKNMTIAQVLLRYSIQQGIPVIPKMSSKERVLENFNCLTFKFTKEEMALLSSIELDGETRFTWDPNSVT